MSKRTSHMLVCTGALAITTVAAGRLGGWSAAWLAFSVLVFLDASIWLSLKQIKDDE